MTDLNLLQLHIDHQNIAQLTFNDESRLNALGLEMAECFRHRVAELSQSSARVVILRGLGRSFSSGGDLAMLEAKSRQTLEENQSQMLEFYCSFLDLLNLEIPVIAALQGYAVGAGCIVAAACDLRVAETNARFSTPFLRMGLFPGMGTTLFLPRAFGSKAVEMLLTGMMVSAQEASDCGFVHRLVDEGQATLKALDLAREILQSAPGVTKNLLRQLRPSREERLAALNQEAQLQGASYLDAEFAQGLQALKRRAPSPFVP